MTVQHIEQRCLVPGSGYGTILDEKRGWLLIQFDDTSLEDAWKHEHTVEIDEPTDYEDYQQII